MVDIDNQVKIVREMGNVVIDLLDIGFVPASYNCPENENGELVFEEDEWFWRQVQTLEQALSQFSEVEIERDEGGYPDYKARDFIDLVAERKTEDGITSELSIYYPASGKGLIMGYIKTPEGKSVDVFDHHAEEISSDTVGRLVARGELSLLIFALESPAEALDYWMIEERPDLRSSYDKDSNGEGVRKITQSKWAKTRGVSRQAVSKHIRSAKTKLGKDQHQSDE